jgi:hypothetical protein
MILISVWTNCQAYVWLFLFIVFLSVHCQTQRSLHPISYQPAKYLRSNLQLPGTTHTAERRTERAASEQTTKLFVNARGEKMFLSWKFSHKIPVLRVNRPTAWETLIHTNGSVLKRFPSMRHNSYQFSFSILEIKTYSCAETYPLIQVTFNVLTLHHMNLYMKVLVSFKTRQINSSETRSTSRCL